MVAVVSDADQPWRLGRAGADSEQQVVAAGLQLARPEDFDLEVVPLRDASRLLGECVRCQLVRGRVLPLTRPVGRLAVFLGGDHLPLAPRAKSRKHQLVDLAPLGRLAGLPRPALESAEDAALDDGLEAVRT